MKVLIIYSNDSKDKVEKLRNRIAERFGKSTVLRMNTANRSNIKKRKLFRHAWHKDAIKMMKTADIIVYAVSNNSSENKNVNWELKKAIKLNKYIVYIPMSPDVTPKNPSLYKVDKNTKIEVCLADKLATEDELIDIIEAFNSDSHIKLFNDPCDPNILIEQYKLFLETAENLVTRRQNVNNFYISANTALITIGGTVFAIGSDGELFSKLAVILTLSIPGILLNISWSKMLQSYYINNQGKMKILTMIEKRLAVSMYDSEWKVMKNKYNKKKYTSFTDNEKKLPFVFTFFYLLIDIISVVVILLTYLICH